MKTTYIDIVFEGDKFSPRKLRQLTNFDIEVLAEYGEISEKGRYKGKPTPYGLGLLKINQVSSEDINSSLKKIIDDLLLRKAALSNSGVDEITLDLENFSENEVEISIDKEIIRKISDLNASIDISSLPNSNKYFTSYYSDKKSIMPFQSVERYFLHDIYSTIISEKQLTNIMSHKQSEKLSTLFAKKIDNQTSILSGVSHRVLMTAMIIYIVRYMQEEDFEKIPSFEKVLKENYSL